MTASAHEPHRTVILILPAVRQVFAMSTAALSVAQCSAKKLAEEYKDALILDQDGTVRKFTRIDILGAYGASTPRKILNLLSGVKTIAVTLSTVAISLSDLKLIIIDCMQNGGFFVDDDADDADDAERHRLAKAIESAPDTMALFQVFKLPAPADSLDVL